MIGAPASPRTMVILCPSGPSGPSSGTTLRVSSQLEVWERALAGRTRWGHLLILAMSKFIWLIPPFTACAAYHTVTASDVATFLRVVCGLISMYSAGVPTLLFGCRRRQLLELLARARRLSEQAEAAEQADAADAGAMAAVARIARWMRTVRLQGVRYIKAGCLLATLEQFSASPAVPPCIQFHDNLPARLAVSVVESAKWTCLASSFFGMWVLILTLQLAQDAQYQLLRARLAAASGRLALRPCCRHLQAVLQLEADMKDFFYDVLLHMLAGALIVPLINTYQLLFGPRTMFSILTLSALPLVYGTMSLLGDRLALGCEEVGLAAYTGPWTEEPVATARLRLMILQSCARRAPFAMSGLGAFTHGRLYHVLRSWYQYLNLLIGTISKTG